MQRAENENLIFLILFTYITLGNKFSLLKKFNRANMYALVAAGKSDVSSFTL